MKTFTAITAMAGVASATSWGDYPSFNTPSKNDNKCEGQQQGGWGWGNLGTGGFSSYDGYDFSGFTCENSFGKRDTLTRRDFQQKVIKGSMSESSGPSFKCGQGKDFSAAQYQISVSRDTDVEMHYSMPDGTTCKQTASCKTGGTVVQNKQCGGAKEVQFKLPQGSKQGCDLGLHHVDFDCSPPATPPSSSAPPPAPPSSSKPASPPSSSPVSPPNPPSSSKPASPPSSSKPVEGPPSSSKPAEAPSSSKPADVPPSSKPYEGPPSSSAPPAPPASSSTPGSPVTSSRPGSPPPASSAPPSPPSNCGGGSGPYGNCTTPPESQPPQPPISSRPEQPPPSSAPPAPPSSSAPVPPPPSSEGPKPPSSSAPQPPPPSSSGPVVPPPSSSGPVVPPPSSSPASPPPPPNNDCPSVLPQCLNTWIQQSGCRDNSDFTCFCPKADFTKNVIQCVTAYGADSATIGKALSYLQGICAAFIPQNPGLVTDCPKDIPITPPAAVSTPAAPVPSDTTTYTTRVITETVSTCTPGQVVTDNGTPTTLTSSKISTITITATNTITTCGACQNGGGSGGGAPVPPKYTTINIADTYTVPCTYSEGVSQGFPIPGSSTITQLTTHVTVPLVQFTTAAPVVGQTTVSIGLANGPPQGVNNGGYGGSSPQTPVAPAPAPTGGYGGGAAPTTVRPSASRTSGGPLQVTANAAPKLSGGKVLAAVAGGAMAIFAL